VGVSTAWDVPLIVLVSCAVAATVCAPASSRRLLPLTGTVLLFLGITAASMLMSSDAAQSLRLSAPLVPAALLFFLIGDRFETVGHTRALYLTFSLVSLGLSGWLLWNAWLDGWVSPNVWAQHAGTPLLVVGNDVTFLAVVAPLSLALIYGHPRRAIAAISGLSILFTVCVIGLFLSRGALLALVVSLGCASALIRPRLAIACGALLLGVTVVVDAALGFPLASKFAAAWTSELPRVSLWQQAWSTFLDSPWVGHGPYTVTYIAADQRESMRWAHNLYLDALVGQGLVGFAALLLLLGSAVSQAWATHRVAQGDVRTLNAAALAALSGFCVAALYEISFLRLWAVVSLFALLGLISHLADIARSQRTAP